MSDTVFITLTETDPLQYSAITVQLNKHNSWTFDTVLLTREEEEENKFWFFESR